MLLGYLFPPTLLHLLCSKSKMTGLQKTNKKLLLVNIGILSCQLVTFQAAQVFFFILFFLTDWS